ncbi:AAA-ATPase ASD, mitochondrial [Daucus carota subsp. sativus]|uniref:AAA-ATPase ASD, mitochondrial n=1 Tax=Daucus carota subsp. sativus TaxID=79200 RepID=UPI0030837DE3
MPRLTVRHLHSLHHQSPPLPNPIQNSNPPIINPSFIPHRPIFNSNPHSIYPVHHVLNPNYKNECKVFAEDSVKITNYYEKNCESSEFSCLVCAGLGQKVGKMLDRALIRTGRMDKHILMSYCSFEVGNRTRKLFTNNKEEGYAGSVWTHVAFVHPATFETLALEPGLKEEIVNDLLTFSKAKDFYGNVGRAWKRGYLLHRPPGTGKSTMVAAMANLLEYDVYDLELTSVENNTELRKLLINTTGKSIIVIEDIDCSLDLTGQRNEEKKEAESSNARDRFKKAVTNEGKDKKTSKVTLSGLLNFIDGLWSACGSERIFVFTTNYIEKVDPALIRTRRMDKHILMSYCSFEVFKVLANKYLNIRFHELFNELFVRIEQLLGEVAVTPAQVVEYLIPKSPEDDGERCLYGLVCALENAKVALREHLAAQEAPQEHGGGLNFCLGPV